MQQIPAIVLLACASFLSGCSVVEGIKNSFRSDPVEVGVDLVRFSEPLQDRQANAQLAVKVVSNDADIQDFLETLMGNAGFDVRTAAFDVPADAAREEWFATGTEQLMSRSELTAGTDMIVLAYIDKTTVTDAQMKRDVFEIDVRGVEVGRKTVAFKSRATHRGGSLLSASPDTRREMLRQVNAKMLPALVERGICAGTVYADANAKAKEATPVEADAAK